MNLRDYLGERIIEDWIVKPFGKAADNLLFSREEAETFVEQAFEYIEANNLTPQLMQLDKRSIEQLVYRIAVKPAEDYVWEVQMEMGLAGKLDTPDGPIYYYTREAENIGERKATYLLSVELSKRRGISPLW